MQTPEAPARAANLLLLAGAARSAPIRRATSKALEAVAFIALGPDGQGMADLLESREVLTHVRVLVL